ncbi:hypothetical protein MSAN_00396400 [Mycena sanguinolenta]|uniref:Uncharacterized protein n=1 Tax=Mycena sanguinolenta TaxID=230812 RepID=A0A8H7DI23_9AGAR|nr:hypothetical protein MSAN_00396400 [Mycena sanguinolenta]
MYLIHSLRPKASVRRWAHLRHTTSSRNTVHCTPVDEPVEIPRSVLIAALIGPGVVAFACHQRVQNMKKDIETQFSVVRMKLAELKRPPLHIDDKPEDVADTAKVYCSRCSSLITSR